MNDLSNYYTDDEENMILPEDTHGLMSPEYTKDLIGKGSFWFVKSTKRELIDDMAIVFVPDGMHLDPFKYIAWDYDYHYKFSEKLQSPLDSGFATEILTVFNSYLMEEDINHNDDEDGCINNIITAAKLWNDRESIFGDKSSRNNHYREDRELVKPMLYDESKGVRIRLSYIEDNAVRLDASLTDENYQNIHIIEEVGTRRLYYSLLWLIEATRRIPITEFERSYYQYLLGINQIEQTLLYVGV